ncbi:hypothetical protein [Costertonia aggregata]|uniref:DUF1574 domain-containing protein n=1 Tax=Costertonia aggregata TaxID=343403 RepID=A0A7H9AT74_9FLAO|nr:hypothetical protein [Costertonia aggregata]QLG46681.1 hypothetical protein HYG79_15425 [Costertonia aggregata]
MKIVKFLIVLIMVDLIFGFFSNEIFFSQKTGKYARIQYVTKKSDAELIVLGSSHAIRHFVPKVLDSIVKKKAYNAGAEGQQLIYHFALQKMILKNKRPDIMVLNIDEDWLYESSVAYRRLSDLHPFYGSYREELYPILKKEDKFISLKLLLNSYRNNSTIVHALRYYLAPQKDYDGYRPLSGVMPKPENIKNINLRGEYSEETINIDFVKVLKKLIQNAKQKNIALVFVTSPKPINVDFSNNTSYSKILEITKNNDIPFFDYSKNPKFMGNYELFHDASHLNDNGARLFTKMVGKDILELINTIKK